jgi:Tfp pilus assembly protein PilF
MSDAGFKAFSPGSRAIACLLALSLAACANQPASKPAPAEVRPVEVKKAPPAPVAPPAPAKAQVELAAGVASYDDGAYRQAERQLQNALSLGLDSGAEQAKAHKYLAFIHCVDGRKKPCASEFSKAFAADRNFDLTPAEAGHPIWGPVFRSQKAAFKKKSK